MPDGREAFLQAHIAPGESLLWVGGPAHRKGADVTTRRFIIGLLAVVVFFCVILGVTVPPVAPYLFLGVLLIGSYLLLAWSGEQETANTCYGLTDRRVLVRRGLLRPKVLSMDLLDIAEVRLFKTLGGVVCLELVGVVNRSLVPGLTAPVLTRGGDRAYDRPAGPRLFGLPDADAVRERILAAQRAVLDPPLSKVEEPS
jgi:hypothetical protein